MKEQGWTKDGRRKGLLYGKCRTAKHITFKTDHKIYCYGWINPTNDEPLDICKDCAFNVET